VHVPGSPRGGSVIVGPGSRACLRERAGRVEGSLAAAQLAQDLGPLRRAQAAQVQVQMLAAVLDN
jgi:hypothetical protein